MAHSIRALLAALLLGLGSSCGIAEEEIVYLREGAALGDTPLCTAAGCPFFGQYCVEIFFEFGRSPALCVFPEVCRELECRKEGYRCALFEGFPGQVKCIPGE